MKNILYKELKLVVSPVVYFLMLLSALLLIPSYPYAVGIAYCILAIFITFNTARMNNDHLFTAMLPVPRNHIVLSKHITVIYIQMLQLIIAIPFALVSSLVLWKGGNMVGMDANFAFFGMQLIALAIFNIIFLPWYFKSGYKTGWPIFVAMLGYVFTLLFFEVIVALVPVLHATIDGLNPATFGYQIIVLGIGIIAYIATAIVSYRLSKKNFEQVSL